jgi:hypothetical protein
VGIHPGDLGQRAELTQVGAGTKEYQKVLVDSGATAAAPSGLPLAGQLLYWKNKSTYTVTNDSRFAVGGQTTNGWRNEVAGVLTCTGMTPGNATWVQQKGNFPTVKIASGSPNPGDQMQSDTSTTAAQGLIAVANTQTTVLALGKFALAQTTVTAASVDLDIPGIP